MAATSAGLKQPFIEHVYELRRRLMVCAVVILAGGVAGYLLSSRLIAILRRPLHQQLFYTTPTGALNFTIKISFAFALIVALPVILYEFVRFISPMMRHVSRLYISVMISLSVALAGGGVLMGYYFSLPAALRFLTNFQAGQIKSLLTANEYLNFVLAYLLASALLFQLPLVMLIINRARPLPPRKLLSLERWVIVGSFIVGALLTPTPDPLNQTIMSVPIILMYQLGVGLVWLSQRRQHRKYQAPASVKPEKAVSRHVSIGPAVGRLALITPRQHAPGPARKVFDIHPKGFIPRPINYQPRSVPMREVF